MTLQKRLLSKTGRRKCDEVNHRENFLEFICTAAFSLLNCQKTNHQAKRKVYENNIFIFKLLGAEC